MSLRPDNMRPPLAKGVPDITSLLPKIEPPPPHDPNVVFAVGDKVRIMSPDVSVENSIGIIKKIHTQLLRMAFVTLDNPSGSERYVPFGFLKKIE